MPDCNNCPYATQIQQVLADMAELRRAKSEAHSDIYNRLNKLEANRESAATETRYIVQQFNSFKAEMKEEFEKFGKEMEKIQSLLSEKEKLPAKRWDVAVAAFISSGMSLLLAWFVNKLSGGTL